MRDRQTQKARAPVLERLAGEALREPVRGVHGREELPWSNRATSDALAEHGVAHRHPARGLRENSRGFVLSVCD
jgi:hypothetical protein